MEDWIPNRPEFLIPAGAVFGGLAFLWYIGEEEGDEEDVPSPEFESPEDEIAWHKERLAELAVLRLEREILKTDITAWNDALIEEIIKQIDHMEKRNGNTK